MRMLDVGKTPGFWQPFAMWFMDELFFFTGLPPQEFISGWHDLPKKIIATTLSFPQPKIH